MTRDLTIKHKQIQKLQELMARSNVPGATQKLALVHARMSKLAVYDETVEVANILKEMLTDIKTRRDLIDRLDAAAKKLLDDCTDKMTEWADKLVALANAKDKAKAEQDRMKLEREKLSGDYHVVEQWRHVGLIAACSVRCLLLTSTHPSFTFIHTSITKKKCSALIDTPGQVRCT